MTRKNAVEKRIKKKWRGEEGERRARQGREEGEVKDGKEGGGGRR